MANKCRLSHKRGLHKLGKVAGTAIATGHEHLLQLVSRLWTLQAKEKMVMEVVGLLTTVIVVSEQQLL
jgi:hypothetical protein